MNRAWSAAAVVVASFVATGGGCGVGRQLVTPREQYRLYRETHVAPTVEARLAAGHRYLKLAPDGEYAPEVRSWFSSTERDVVLRAHDSLPRLRAYLAALPDGPRAGEVRQRERELEDVLGSAKDRELNRDARLANLQADLERAAEQRSAFLEQLRTWIGRLSEARAWGQAPTSLDAALVSDLALDDPATCQLDVCEKSLVARFAIPHAQGRLVPRDASFGVEIVLSGGSVAEIRLQGRELFSRVGEALDLKAVSFADPLARAEAIGRALVLVTGALGDRFPEDRCARPAVSPVVLDRACDGTRITVTAAVDTGQSDVIAFAPEPVPAPDAGAPPGKRGQKAKPAPAAKPVAPATPSAAPAPPVGTAPAFGAPVPGN